MYLYLIYAPNMTNSYHEEGSAAVVAKTADEALDYLDKSDKRNISWGDTDPLNREKAKILRELPLAAWDDEPGVLHVFPDAGCC